MATVVLAYDHSRDPMYPGQLADQIATALSLSTQPTVDISPTDITVTHPNVTAANTAAIQSLIGAYVLDPAWQGVSLGNAGVLQVRAQKALAVNTTFLAVSSPTAAQVTAQVRALTRECNAVIRLLIGQTDVLTDS